MQEDMLDTIGEDKILRICSRSQWYQVPLIKMRFWPSRAADWCDVLVILLLLSFVT